MVQQVEGTAAERWLNRITRRIPARFRSYVISLVALAIVVAIAWPIRQIPQGSRGILGPIAALLSLLVLLGSSWLGYGSGLLVWTLMIVLARLTNPAVQSPPRQPMDPMRLVLLLMVSVSISALGSSRRRREAELMRAAEGLEESVRLRTAEATRAALEAREKAQSLREQAQLLDLAHDAILTFDSNGAIRFWNRGAEKMYGWAREEALGKIVHDLLQTEFPEPLAEIEQRAAAAGHWEGELVHTHKNGAKLRILSRWAIRAAREREPAAILEINTDVTGLRRIEEQMRHAQKLESLGVLAGGVAHDFNNLLTGILGNSSLARESLSPHHPVRAMIDEVMRAAERAADLTRQLLAYAGKGRFVMRTVDVSALVREIGSLVQASLPKQAQLRLQLADNLPGVDADPGQIQQIIMNLVINGAEAIGPQGGSVLVRTFAQEVDENYISTMSAAGDQLTPGQYVALEVHDTGSGMDEDTLAKIFDPFFSTKFAGRGLGLSAVLGIVRAHRGALKVYSQPGQGTTFKALFPASPNSPQPQPVPMKRELDGAGIVLVVDDEEIVRMTARHTLEHYGYRTLLAHDGAAALEAYRNRLPDIALVLLDLTMPVMNGEETLRRLQIVNPGVKVLLSSGYNEVEAVQRFAGKGLAGFIQKPYTAAALAEKVKEALVG
jgi:PAS domain S-box-containing protein